MADRNLATNNGGLTRPGVNPRGSATLAGVRRNFFQGQQPSRARRPGPVTADSAETAETVRLDADVPNANTSDIVVRDQHGEIKWGDPPSPDLDESMELPDESRQEVEQERQRLAEAIKSHQRSSNAVPDQPEEVLEAVKASLRAKVAALAEDNWMYEPEEQNRLP